VTLSKAQRIEDQLAAASVLTENGEGQQALELYNKVLTEDPEDPIALAAGGWLEWNAGVSGKSAAAERAGRQSEEKAVRYGPSFYGGHLYLGLIMLDQDDNAAGAIDQFTAFLADGPSKAEIKSVSSQIAPAWSQLHEPLPAALAAATTSTTTSTGPASTTTTTASAP
jgi:tetratricopeptide (TPR) repeat protein